MGANPDPLDGVTNQMPDGPIMVADSDGKAIRTTLQFLEMEGRMPVVSQPKCVFAFGRDPALPGTAG